MAQEKPEGRVRAAAMQLAQRQRCREDMGPKDVLCVKHTKQRFYSIFLTQPPLALLWRYLYLDDDEINSEDISLCQGGPLTGYLGIVCQS